MGFPSAQRLLDAISTSELLEWVEWQKIRGPIGLDRLDYYVKRIQAVAGGPYPEGKAPTLDDLRMPWDPEPSAALTKPTEEDRRRRREIFLPPGRRTRIEDAQAPQSAPTP